MPGEKLGGGAEQFDDVKRTMWMLGEDARKEAGVVGGEAVVEGNPENSEQEDARVSLEVPVVPAEDTRKFERAEIERDHEGLEKAFMEMDLGVEKTLDMYAKYLKQIKDETGENNRYSDEQIEDMVYLYEESLKPAAGGDLDENRPPEGELDGATNVDRVRHMLDDGSIRVLADALGDPNIIGRAEQLVDNSTNEVENSDERVREGIWQKLKQRNNLVKTVAVTALVAVLAGAVLFGASKLFGNNSAEAKAATEADANSDADTASSTPEVAVSEAPVEIHEEVEEKSILDDEHLFDGELDLSKYDLGSIGAAALERYVSEDGKEVFANGTIANYTDYLSEDKSSRYAFGESEDFVHELIANGNIQEAKEEIVKTYASNPQALAAFVADTPGLMERIGVSKNILEMKDVGAQARALMGLMRADNEGDNGIKSGGEWQQEFVGAMYAAVMHPDTTLESVVANGEVATFFIAPVNSADEEVIDYLPYTNTTTRNDVKQIRLNVKYSDASVDGKVQTTIGSVNLNTYCGYQPDYKVRKLVIIVDGNVKEEVEINASETPDVPTPDYNEPEPPAPPEPGETPDDAIKRKNAANLQAGVNQGLKDQQINNTVTQTPVIGSDEAATDSVPADTTGDQTPVGAVTEKPSFPSSTETVAPTPNPAPAEPTPTPTPETPAPAQVGQPAPAPAPSKPESPPQYTEQDYNGAL